MVQFFLPPLDSLCINGTEVDVYRLLGAGMQRFIEQQNIALFQRLLLEETSEAKRQLLRSLLLNSERKLAMIEVTLRGAYSTAFKGKERLFSLPTPRMTSQFQHEFETATMPMLLIDPRPGLPS